PASASVSASASAYLSGHEPSGYITETRPYPSLITSPAGLVRSGRTDGRSRFRFGTTAHGGWGGETPWNGGGRGFPGNRPRSGPPVPAQHPGGPRRQRRTARVRAARRETHGLRAIRRALSRPAP